MTHFSDKLDFTRGRMSTNQSPTLYEVSDSFKTSLQPEARSLNSKRTRIGVKRNKKLVYSATAAN